MQRLMRAAIGTQQHRQLLARLPLADVVRAAQVARPARAPPARSPTSTRPTRRSSSARTRPRAIRSSARGSSRRRCAACRLVTIDPRRIELADYARAAPRAAPGHERRDHARARARGRARRLGRPRVRRRPHRGLRGACEELLADYTPADVEEISGVPAADLERAAHIYAEAGERVDPLGPRRDRAQVRLRGRAADLQPRADDRQARPPRLGAAAAARPEQRPGLVRHGRAAGHLHRLPAGRRRGRRARASSSAWGVAMPRERGLKIPEMFDAAVAGEAEGDVHLRRGRRADRPEHDARRSPRSSRSSSSSARTSSRPRRPSSPT